jgi:hypothetical protein
MTKFLVRWYPRLLLHSLVKIFSWALYFQTLIVRVRWSKVSDELVNRICDIKLILS